MENVNWLKLKLNEKMMNLQSAKANINANLSSENGVVKDLVKQAQNNIINQVQNQIMNPQQLRMNNLASIDRAVYVKNLLNLPKDMVELLVMVQNEGKATTTQNQQQQINNPQLQQNLPQTQQQTQQTPLQQNNINLPNENIIQKNNANPQTQVQQASIIAQNQTINQPVLVNPQIQPPEQPQVQNQSVKEQKQNSQQQNQQQNPSTKEETTQPQRQIQANKEVFTQQLNNAKQNIPAPTQKNEITILQQTQQNQPQVTINKPTANSTAQLQQPSQTQAQPQQPQIQTQAQQTQPSQTQTQPQQPQIQTQAQQTQPSQTQTQPQQPQIQTQAQQTQPSQALPHQQPEVGQFIVKPNNTPIQQQSIQYQNDTKNIPQNRHDKLNHEIKHEIRNSQIENRPNHLNNSQRTESHNIKQNIQHNSTPVFDRGESFIRDTKQHIYQKALNNPHNHLHNNVKNQVRQPMLHHKLPQEPLENEQLEQITPNKTQEMTAEELAQFKKRLASQLNENVNLSNVSALLQKNSKIAMNKMVSMMTIATAQGMTDIKPLQDTVNIINASVSANSSNSATQTLKNLMLLYLPWLPLQEGVGFDLEIEQDEEIPEADTFIKIMITTVNFGNLHATVSLITGNSVDIAITCSEKFPKKELFKRLSKDGSQHSMQTAIDIKEQKPQEQLDTKNAKAKVNLANVNQVNPYLLLMSHAIIRHTIELDATVSIGKQPIEEG